MPLITGKSPESFSKNVETEMKAGKPQKQAVAIAYAKKREAEQRDRRRAGDDEDIRILGAQKFGGPMRMKKTNDTWYVLKADGTILHGGPYKEVIDWCKKNGVNMTFATDDLPAPVPMGKAKDAAFAKGASPREKAGLTLQQWNALPKEKRLEIIANSAALPQPFTMTKDTAAGKAKDGVAVTWKPNGEGGFIAAVAGKKFGEVLVDQGIVDAVLTSGQGAGFMSVDAAKRWVESRANWGDARDSRQRAEDAYDPRNPKIDIYVDGAYKFSTNWSRTIAEALEKAKREHPEWSAHKVTARKSAKDCGLPEPVPMGRDASQYTEQYLDTGYTPQTFLAYNLKGKAKQYSGRYLQALLNDLRAYEAAGRAFRGKSKAGGTAWFRKPQGSVEDAESFKIGDRVKITAGSYKGNSGTVIGREDTYRTKVKLAGVEDGGVVAIFNDDMKLTSSVTDTHEGYAKLEHSLAHRKGVTDPHALAAYIGREKYGAKGMAKKSAAGRAKDAGSLRPTDEPVQIALKLIRRKMGAKADEVARFYNALGDDKTPSYIADWFIHDMKDKHWRSVVNKARDTSYAPLNDRRRAGDSVFTEAQAYCDTLRGYKRNGYKLTQAAKKLLDLEEAANSGQAAPSESEVRTMLQKAKIAEENDAKRLRLTDRRAAGRARDALTIEKARMIAHGASIPQEGWAAYVNGKLVPGSFSLDRREAERLGRAAAKDTSYTPLTARQVQDGAWEDQVDVLAKNVRDKVRELKADGVVGMGRRNFRQVVSTRGINVAPGAFDRLLDEAIKKAGVGRFIYAQDARARDARLPEPVQDRRRAGDMGFNTKWDNAVLQARMNLLGRIDKSLGEGVARLAFKKLPDWLQKEVSNLGYGIPGLAKDALPAPVPTGRAKDADSPKVVIRETYKLLKQHGITPDDPGLQGLADFVEERAENGVSARQIAAAVLRDYRNVSRGFDSRLPEPV